MGILSESLVGLYRKHVHNVSEREMYSAVKISKVFCCAFHNRLVLTCRPWLNTEENLFLRMNCRRISLLGNGKFKVVTLRYYIQFVSIRVSDTSGRDNDAIKSLQKCTSCLELNLPECEKLFNFHLLNQ